MPFRSFTLAIPADADEYSLDVPEVGNATQSILELQADIESLPAGATIELVADRPTSGYTGPFASWTAEGLQELVPLASWRGPLKLRGKSAGTEGDAVIHLSWW